MAKKTLSYTQALKRLEELVRGFESEEADIDSLCQQLAEAQSLLKYCKERLTQVEDNVNKLLQDGKE